MSSSSQAQASAPLFRIEAMQAQNDHRFGTIRLAQPASRALAAGVSTLLAVALIAFICLGSVTRKTRVAGVISPKGGSVLLRAPAAGVVARAPLADNAGVAAGAAVFELSTERQNGQGEISQLVRQQLMLRQEALHASRASRLAREANDRKMLQQKLAALREQRVQLEGEVELSAARVRMGESDVTRFRSLEAGGFVSPAQTQQRVDALLDLRLKLGVLQRSLAQVASDERGIDSERVSLREQLAADLAQLDSAAALITQELQENMARARLVVTAPTSGRLTVRAVEAGQAVLAGQVLGTIIPDDGNAGPGTVEAHLFAPSRAAGFVQAGQSVRLRYRAFPYQKFGLHQGRVIDVSSTPFAPADLPPSVAGSVLAASQEASAGESLYRIKVTIEKPSISAYGKEQPIKVGMLVDADILQDTRSIWEWVAEPLIAAARR